MKFFLRVMAPAHRDDLVESLEAEYLRRLAKRVHAEVVRVRPGGGAGAEAAALRKAAPRGGLHVALDERGDALTSVELARYIGQARDRSVPGVTFWIGGADGLDPALLREADRRLSLGRLTLPHRLARLVLVEQLYRAMTILHGDPYHRS
ncbi:MAG TPA: 23S rRNA (pseudouridine(1915)-N(3))-methyltransferase RlmH [Myxococcota bacterium]|jgi:23S rRNA (pseudouridine1915-N3)-methyltransferase|nr:23S rRNA (pseudouridine(1915)-N(3))-methyltransferase RlmH [Myxococcota bacterium]